MQRGADVGASCALVFLELLALAVIVVVWPFLDHFDLDPASDAEMVSLWRYLPALGGVAVVAFVAAVLAGRARHPRVLRRSRPPVPSGRARLPRGV
ncbi:DUF6234 family protein [Streptomyces niveus]|uniref:DUF6234 family protein n=1 Tax=Streptomyces niveus TaxID=193462 RepID=UPI003446CA49